MKKSLRTKLYHFLGQKLYRVLMNAVFMFDTNYQYSYSQEGEDLILRGLFRNFDTGFYVDVGAYHPFIFSNTYLFYRMGWRGMNIDARPGSMKLFAQKRPRDINIEVPISETNEKLTFFLFDEPALNTFSKELAIERRRQTKFHQIGEVEVHPQRLEAIFSKQLPHDQLINFLSIDVEGHEMSVLKSNNWDIYRPSVILVEKLDCSVDQILNTELHSMLSKYNYRFYSKTLNTLFYLCEEFHVDSKISM